MNFSPRRQLLEILHRTVKMKLTILIHFFNYPRAPTFIVREETYMMKRKSSDLDRRVLLRFPLPAGKKRGPQLMSCWPWSVFFLLAFNTKFQVDDIWNSLTHLSRKINAYTPRRNNRLYNSPSPSRVSQDFE